MVWMARGLGFGILVTIATILIPIVSGREESCRMSEGTVVVEVLNGCGVKGIGEGVASRLSDHGFDVLFIGNADRFDYAETIAIARSQDKSKAIDAANMLGTGNIIVQVLGESFVDVTVIVGNDLVHR